MNSTLKPVLLGAAVAMVAIVLVAVAFFVGKAMTGGSDPAAVVTPSPSWAALDGTPTAESEKASAPPGPSSSTSAPSESSTVTEPLRVTMTTKIYPANKSWSRLEWTSATVSGGVPAVTAKINSALATWNKNWLRNELGTRGTVTRDPGAMTDGDIEQNLEEVPCFKGYLCFRLMHNEVYPGAAHGVAEYEVMVFDRSTGGQAELTDFITPSQLAAVEQWVNAEYPKITNGLAADPSDSQFTMSGLKSWLPLKDGLWLYFPRYALGYAPLETTAPWSYLTNPPRIDPAAAWTRHWTSPSGRIDCGYIPKGSSGYPTIACVTDNGHLARLVLDGSSWPVFEDATQSDYDQLSVSNAETVQYEEWLYGDGFKCWQSPAEGPNAIGMACGPAYGGNGFSIYSQGAFNQYFN